MADPFLDGKPMKLSKNGSDVICVFAFHDSSCRAFCMPTCMPTALE